MQDICNILLKTKCPQHLGQIVKIMDTARQLLKYNNSPMTYY